jgi:spore coat protein A
VNRSAVSRRAFLSTVAGLTGLAVSGCSLGKPHHGALDDTSNGTASGSYAGSVGGSLQPGLLNYGIPVTTSQVTLPERFKAALPIPARLTPRRSGDTDYYEIVQREARQEIIPGLPTPIWGYNGTFPGPTIVSTRGRRTVVNHRNELPVPTVVHLHGGQTPADQDGYPTDYLLPAGTAAPAAMPAMPNMPGMAAMDDPAAHVTRVSRDYSYPVEQRAATLWYHDHRMGFTGGAVNRGLAGFHLIEDDEELALPLPTGDRDIPLMICDRAFAADGSFLYPALDPTLKTTPGVTLAGMKGTLGDVILVNGAPWPELKVGTGRYRFRILNASNARTYQLALSSTSGSAVFTQIGTDGGLLAAPVEQSSLVIAPAQRFDVIIDFGRLAVGDQVTLINQADTGSVDSIMRFTVDRRIKDVTRIPERLSTIAAIDPKPISTHRKMDFRFNSSGRSWTINGKPFDPAGSEATVKNGSTELWTITSDAFHPVHLHLANFQVISRNGGGPGPFDHGWKDTVLVGPNDTVQIAARFQGTPGRYMLHCHNLEHEDMAMMANYHVVA